MLIKEQRKESQEIHAPLRAAGNVFCIQRHPSFIPLSPSPRSNLSRLLKKLGLDAIVAGGGGAEVHEVVHAHLFLVEFHGTIMAVDVGVTIGGSRGAVVVGLKLEASEFLDKL